MSACDEGLTWALQLTSGCIKPATAPLAFEVLRLLVIDQDLEIIEVALAVVAPWPRENFGQVRMIALLFRHIAKAWDREVLAGNARWAREEKRAWLVQDYDPSSV